MPLRTALMLLCVVVAILAVAFKPRVEAEVVRDAPGCPGSGDVPVVERAEEAKAAVLCLLNAERARHGLQGLVRVVSLDNASQAHSEDMAARNFFEHDTPDGIDARARITAAGYSAPTVAENLYWGEEAKATPVGAHAGWMKSPGHRANILRPELRAVGVGIAYEAPVPGVTSRVGVYTTDFGSLAPSGSPAGLG